MIEDLPVFADLVPQERAAFFHVNKIDIFLESVRDVCLHINSFKTILILIK